MPDDGNKTQISLINVDFSALGKFGEKLLATTERAVVGALAPTQIRRIALAEGDRIRILGEANADASVSAERGEARSMELRHRAISRIASQEEFRQRNIENIVAEAANHATPEPASKPVSEDWISAFFEACQDSSDKEMQILWAKLLAGEVAEPGGVSKALLNSVRLMSARDATAFQSLSEEIFSTHPFSGRNCALFFADYRNLNFSFGGIDIEKLVLLQLVKDEGNFVSDLSSTKDTYELMYFGRRVILRQTPQRIYPEGDAPILRELTQLGRELWLSVRPQSVMEVKDRVTAEFGRRGISVETAPPG